MSVMATDLLSELYWKLHRNSLISSGLLFLSAAHFIVLSNYDGAVVKIPENIQSILLFTWATYAIAVLCLEGRKDESSKSATSRAEIEKKRQTLGGAAARMVSTADEFSRLAKQSLDKIIIHLNNADYQDAINSATKDRMWSNIQLLEVEVSELEFQDGRFEQVTDVNKIKKVIFDKVFGEMKVLSLASASDLEQSQVLLNNAISFIDKMRNEFKLILRKNERAKALELSTETARAFFTGVYIPIGLYIIAISHFLGLYFDVFPSILDVFSNFEPFSSSASIRF